MLEAILKKNVGHDTFETEPVVYAKNRVEICYRLGEIAVKLLLSRHFVNSGHVGSHFEKKVDHDTFKTER